MLYAPIPRRDAGLLDVGDGHQLYWEESGNAAGQPVVILHGGPGGSCSDRHRRWCHPDRFRTILFDQRGCGRSTPPRSIAHNTTHHLIEDLERLRLMLGIQSWIVMGHSWGSTLALAYAQAHPDRVTSMILSGVFTARCFEREWLYSTEAARTCHEVMSTGTPDAQAAAAEVWCRREDDVTSTEDGAAPLDSGSWLSRARIGAHYFVNDYFLTEGQLLAEAHRLRAIHGIIVHGREDLVTPPISACDLHRAWPGSRLELVADAGHATTDLPLMRGLMDATDSLLSNLLSGSVS